MQMVVCMHCNAVFEPVAPPLGEFVRCRECGRKTSVVDKKNAVTVPRPKRGSRPPRKRRRNRRRVSKPARSRESTRETFDFLFRLVMFAVFVGTFVNFCYGMEISRQAPNDPNEDFWVHRVTPLLACGLFGAYFAWNGLPEINITVERISRVDGVVDMLLGVGVIVFGVAISVAVSVLMGLIAGGFGLAIGTILTGCLLILRGFVKLITGRDFGGTDEE